MDKRNPFYPLEIELKKVAALGGKMSVVVVPQDYKDHVVRNKRETDTTVYYRDFVIIATFGLGVEESDALFLSIPKGIAGFPQDGDDIQSLYLLAMQRLRFSDSSPWVQLLWESIKEVKKIEKQRTPVNRFISSSFYQLYAFMASHPEEIQMVLSSMTPAEQVEVKGLLPHGIVGTNPEEKPISPQALSRVVDGWGYQEKMQEKLEKGKNTLRRFRTIEHLFTLPSISRQVLDLVRDPLISAVKLAALIEHDPVLTSRLLKVVNSAFYGFPRQINSVEHAVVILGNEEVVNLSFSIAVYDVIKNLSPKNTQVLWEHSLLVAHLAQWLGSELERDTKDMIYTLGLLHDLGKIVFLQRGEKIGALERASDLNDLAEEESIYGLTHAEMGAFIAERWNLPEPLVDGLLAHHLPSKATHLAQAATIHIADMIAHTGSMNLEGLNHTAVCYLKGRKKNSLSAEIVAQTHADLLGRVRNILHL